MTDPRVDPETGAARYRLQEPGKRIGWIRRHAAVIVSLLLTALVVWAVWSWTPFGLRVDVGELETRVERLERLHQVNHELEALREEYRREQAELDAIPGPEVPL